MIQKLVVNVRKAIVRTYIFRYILTTCHRPRPNLYTNFTIINFMSKEFNKKSIINLDLGRKIRHKQLKQFRKDIPRISQIITDNSLDVEKWFKSYKKLIEFGARQFTKIERKENKLVLEYSCIAKGKKKLFTKILPRKLKIDEEFTYYLGLWIGDKAGGRFGVVNKNIDILNFTENYLKTLYQKTESYLYLGEEEPNPRIKVDKTYITKNKNIHTTNGILKSFFTYLEKDIEDLLPYLDINIFLAGLFDAEGNISLEDKNLRLSCKNKILLPKLIKIFKDLNLYRRYDGANIVSYDLDYFNTYILKYIKNEDKINRFNLIYYKKGYLEPRFLNTLEKINRTPGITRKELAKVLKRIKVHSQARFLEDLGYIKTMNYPISMYITPKGLESINRISEEARP